MASFHPRLGPPPGATLLPLAIGLPWLASACGAVCGASVPSGVVSAIGAENEYADVVAQIGGPYVHVASILNNPNTDPHTYESSPSVAREVSGAQLIVQNGVGYDGFMNKIESAAPELPAQGDRGPAPARPAGQHPQSPPVVRPRTMPAVAAAIGADLSALQPGHAALFAANVRRFDSSLKPWLQAIANFKAQHGGTPVATTEPVADYLLAGDGRRQPDPVPVPGRHHERHRPLAPGHLARARLGHQASR